MEEIKEGEQPLLNDEGSPVGKFKDVESLKIAYENLEKEFTKKSQTLSNLQKNFKKNEKNDNFISTFSNNLEKSIKIWEQDDWDNQVENFLKNNPKAKNFSKEICDLIVKDKVVQESSQPLLTAWTKYLENNFKSDDEFINDENNFLSITQNEKVKKAIIKEYLSDLKKHDFIPPVFSKNDGSGISETKPYSPKTLEEAKELVKQIFK